MTKTKRSHHKITAKQLLLPVIFLIHPLFAVNTASGQCNQQGCHDVELKIMSWNIYMLPHFWIHTGQLQRATEIVDALKDEDVDIIVFEEAFDKESRNIIRKGLGQYFPYESGDPGRNKFWKSSSGVWVLSKVPIFFIKQIYFRESEGADKLACKGAMLLRAEKNNVCFQIIGTHLQSELQNKNVQNIRYKQYEQIRKELLEPFEMENVPQFVVGDLNTMKSDSLSYKQMLSSLNVMPCEMTGSLNYSFDYKNNDLIKGSTEKPQLIDYILLKKNPGIDLKGNMWVKPFKKKWTSNHKDLSDHFAVTGVISL